MTITLAERTDDMTSQHWTSLTRAQRLLLGRCYQDAYGRALIVPAQRVMVRELARRGYLGLGYMTTGPCPGSPWTTAVTLTARGHALVLAGRVSGDAG